MSYSSGDDTGCGEVREVSRSESGVAFEWTPIFCPKSESEKECCKSPKIRAMASTWVFSLYPNGGTEVFRGWIPLAFYRLDPLARDVRFEIGVKLAGETGLEIASKRIFPQGFAAFFIPQLLLRSKVVKGGSKVNLTGQLTITCQMWTVEGPILEGVGFMTPESTTDSLAVLSAKEKERSHLSPEDSTPTQSDGKLIEKEFVSRETQTDEQSDATAREGNGANLDTKVDSTLQKHLKDLLLTGDDHDVTIKVGNQEFRAHKSMLRARSPVFAAMFKHEMKESQDGSITIDDCDPDAFGEFLNYVYTGKVEDLSPKKATRLYYAGDKYDFSGLKEVCAQFLEASLSTTSICDVVDLATRHGEKGLLESANKFFSKNMKEILITVEWQRFAPNNFVAANELILRAIEATGKKSE